MLMIPQKPHQESLLANLQTTWPPGPFRSKKRELKNLFKSTLIHCQSGVIKWKIKLNPSKTQVGLFTNSNTDTAKEITLNLGRVSLTVSNEIKFLGLTFDRKLTWRHHIDNVRHRMWLRINAIKAISGRNLGMQSKALIHLYKMWIRPIALYGAPAYYSAAKTHLNKIQVIQNSALRVALRKTRRTHMKLHTYSHKAKDGSLQDDSQDRTGNDEEQREEIGDRVQQKEEAVMKNNFVKFASERLKVKIEGPDIVAIHTLKKRPDGMEPVLVKFGYNSVKRDIMSARKRLKGTDIYINDQLTKKNAEIEKRQES